MLVSFINERTLLNLLHAVNIVIPSANDAHDGFSGNLIPEHFKRSYRQRTGWLRYNRIFIVEIEHGRTNFALGNRHGIIKQFAADRERQLADPLYCSAINEFVDMLKRNDFPGI